MITDVFLFYILLQLLVNCRRNRIIDTSSFPSSPGGSLVSRCLRGCGFQRNPLVPNRALTRPSFSDCTHSSTRPLFHSVICRCFFLSSYLYLSIHPSVRPFGHTHPPIHSATCMHSIASSHNAQSLQSRGAFSKSNLQSRIKCCFQGDGCMEEWIERCMDRKMDGWMDGKQMKGRKGPRGYQGNQDSMTTWQPFFMFGYLKCSAILYWKLILVTRQMMARK